MLRDLKDREARRKRDEDARLNRKAAEEAEDVAKMFQVKHHMKNKPLTYDSEGNIIWIEPVNIARLPPTTPVPQITLKNAKRPEEPKRVVVQTKKKSARAPPQFVHGFEPFSSQQPSMITAMELAPGVELTERGRVKRGSIRPDHVHRMTRKNYEDLVEQGAEFKSSVYSLQEHDVSVAPTYDASQRASETGVRQTSDTERESVRLQKVVSGSSLPPSVRVPPVKIPRARRSQLKRDALGNAVGTRARQHALGTVGMRRVSGAAQPPLGATMGHGLLLRGDKHEEFYFPAELPPARQVGAESVAESEGPPAAIKGGQIVTRNPELVQRFFSSHTG